MPALTRRLMLCCVSMIALSGCATFTFPEKEVTALTQVPEGYVLLVGKIELTPELRDTEIEINVPNDIFNTEEMMSNRAIIGLSTRADVPMEKSGFLINPELGRTFFFAVPRDRVHMLGGYITVAYSMSVRGPYNTTVNHGKVLVPGGLQFDIRPTDQMLYVGTLSLQRDPFNEVIGARIVDDYASASIDLENRLGSAGGLRKALPLLPRTHTAAKTR